ncbi:MAG: hypothetical protein U0457_05990 [Candidatus Sericytochromatia bacterium]
MEDSKYSFSLRMEQVEFSVGGDKEFVETNMKKWLNLFKDKLPSGFLGEEKEEENKHDPKATMSRGKLSITDFIKMKAPKNYQDLLLTVLFYNERYEGMENTGVPLRLVADFASKLPNPPSSDDINAIFEQLTKDGFIQMMEGTESYPKYQVSFGGEQLVKQGFAQS